jgi:hypothetical protein
VLDSGPGVVDLADNLVLFGRVFDANHEMGVAGAGPGESENHDGIIVRKIQAGGRRALLHGLAEIFHRGAFQSLKEHVGRRGDVVRRERDWSAVKKFGAVFAYQKISVSRSPCRSANTGCRRTNAKKFFLPLDFEQFPMGPCFARISQNFMRCKRAASFSEGLTFIFLRIFPWGACAPVLNGN